MAFQPAAKAHFRFSDRPSVWLLLLFIAIMVASWQCESDKQGVTAPPVETHQFIDSTDPIDGAVDVPLRSCIRITFRNPMDTATMTAKKFILDGGITYSVSRDSMKVVICPGHELDRGAEYRVVIDSGIADMAGNVMTTRYTFSFQAESGNPLISTISPANGQTGVPLDAKIIVTFMRAMDTATLNSGTVLLSNDIGGTITYSDRRLVFTPNDSLESSHTYTVTLRAAVSDSAGLTLGQDYSWTFTTGKFGKPYVVSELPTNGAMQVSVSTDISIRFSESIDSTTISADEFTVSGGVSGTLKFLVTSVVFHPTVNLQPRTAYTATFHGDITSMTGHTAHIDHTWTFTTKYATATTFDLASSYPVSDAGCIPLDASIRMVFSHLLDSTTIIPANFIFEEFNGGRLSGSLSGHDSIVVFQPDVPFVALKEYKATVLTGIKDIDGMSLPHSRSWRFSAKGENLLPLAIGNKWFYQVAQGQWPIYSFDTLHVDSIVIVSDSTVGGTRYYVDQYKRLYRYENDTLEVSFRFAFNPWPPLHSFGNVDCAGFKAVTITTDSASYLCQPITYVYSNSGYYDSRGYKFSPGIGLVRFDEHTSTPSSGSDVYTAWQLFSYQLQR